MQGFDKPKSKQNSASNPPRLSVQKKLPPSQNPTGIPNVAKARFENLSRPSFYDVHAHHNSDKPAQLMSAVYGDVIQLEQGDERRGEVAHRMGDMSKKYVRVEVPGIPPFKWFLIPEAQKGSYAVGTEVVFTEGPDETIEMILTPPTAVAPPPPPPAPTNAALQAAGIVIYASARKHGITNIIIANTVSQSIQGQTFTQFGEYDRARNSYTYRVSYGNGITSGNWKLGYMLFGYCFTDQSIRVFHAHGDESPPISVG